MSFFSFGACSLPCTVCHSLTLFTTEHQVKRKRLSSADAYRLLNGRTFAERTPNVLAAIVIDQNEYLT